jgi:hypothetical protein
MAYYYPHAVAAPAPASPKATHVHWYGSTRAEVDAQNAAILKAHAKPTQMAPYKPSADQQFWCRELDNSYTLRTAKDINDNLQPGVWQYGDEGYPFFIRQEKKK